MVQDEAWTDCGVQSLQGFEKRISNSLASQTDHAQRKVEGFLSLTTVETELCTTALTYALESMCA